MNELDTAKLKTREAVVDLINQSPLDMLRPYADHIADLLVNNGLLLKNSQPSQITLDELLALCNDSQEIILINDNGDTFTSCPSMMSTMLIPDILKMPVVDIETEDNALKVWI